MVRNTLTSYGSIAKTFHWLIFFLVLFMLFLGYFMDDVAQEARGQVYNIHKLTGLSILVLMILRLLWTLTNPKPIIPDPKLWERFAAHSVHYFFYFLLIAMPIAGWIMSSAAGKSPHLFHWMIALPISQSKPTAGLFASIHNTLAIVIIVTISLHVLAALYHYYVRKDNVLQRMMPGDSV